MSEARDTEATYVLAADHRTVEDLFEKYEKASGENRKREIASHMRTASLVPFGEDRSRPG